MENNIESIETQQLNTNTRQVETQYIISWKRFLFLSIISCGLYEAWWIYKSWRFFKQKDSLNVAPAARALFSLFFLVPLLNLIIDYSSIKGYKGRFSPYMILVGSISANLCSKLPDPYWLITFVSVIFFIPPFKALNYAKRQATDIGVVEQTSFNTRQIILITIGSAVWMIYILGSILEIFYLL